MVNPARSLLVAFGVLAVAACTPSPGNTPTTAAVESTTSAPTTLPSLPTSPEADDFDAYVEIAFRTLVARSPQSVTDLGLSSEYDVRNDQLDDLSDAYLEGTEEIRVEILNLLDLFDPDNLSRDQNATLQAFRWHLQQQSALHAFRLHDWPVHFLVTSYNQGVIGLFTEIHPISNRNDADDHLARFDALDVQVEQVIENLRSSVDLGVVPPRYVVDATIGQLESDLAGGVPENTAIFRAFESRIGALGLNAANVADYVAGAKTTIEHSFFPAWRSLIEYLELIRDQAATSAIGLSRRPDGEGIRGRHVRSRLGRPIPRRGNRQRASSLAHDSVADRVPRRLSLDLV